MLELNQAIFYHPEKQHEEIEGRVYVAEGKLYCELYKHGSPIDIALKPIIDILWVKDKKSEKKYSFVNLFIKSSIDTNATYKVNELYTDAWIGDIHERIYKRCIVQMSGLALWIEKFLIKSKYSDVEEQFNFSVKNDEEVEFNFQDGLKIIFRKFHSFKREHLSVSINERASLVISTSCSQSRFHFNRIVKSFQNILSISLSTASKLWEIDYRYEDDSSCKLQLSKIGTDEILQRGQIRFTLREVQKEFFEAWFSKADELNEISAILIEARENIVAETKFTYATKALELLYKNIFLPQANSILLSTKVKMEVENVWEPNWIKPITIENSKGNFRLVLCTLWEMFVGKDGFNDYLQNPFAFLKKVHENRNYYTHYGHGFDIWKPSQLITINKILISFSYGLMLQYLNFNSEKLTMFVKAFCSFSISTDYDSNIYSIDYREDR